MTAQRAADRQLRCRLGDKVPSAANDLEPIARRSWHERGFVSISITDPALTRSERAALAGIAERRFGRRNG